MQPFAESIRCTDMIDRIDSHGSIAVPVLRCSLPGYISFSDKLFYSKISMYQDEQTGCRSFQTGVLSVYYSAVYLTRSMEELCLTGKNRSPTG